jgi:hypothetical protein
VLSGDYYQPLSTSSPHQIWSAAMVISPILRGLFGLQTDAAEHRVTFSPHVPADWTSFAIHNVRAGDTTLDLNFQRSADEITLSIASSGTATLEFSPAVSLNAKIIGAELNGSRVTFQLAKNSFDQHVSTRAPLIKGKNTIRIRLRNDFGISITNSLPALGSRSVGLRITSQSWSQDTLTLNAQGIPGAEYQLAIFNPAEIRSVEGGEVQNGKLTIRFPSNPAGGYSSKKIVIHFRPE